MTSVIPPEPQLIDSVAVESALKKGPAKTESKEGSGRYVQEKVMAGLVLVFFLGVVALTVVPEPFNDAAMALVIILTVLAMFKFN